MPRRLAAQVHQATARLLKANIIPTPPVWYSAVLAYPPLPLPPRATPPRTSHDLPTHKSNLEKLLQTKHVPFHSMHTPPPKPQEVHYLEDRLRQQFFRDHPFEAFRPRTLVENGEVEEEHPIQGDNWTRLRQHGRNPSSEDAVRFAYNLHKSHNLPLNAAYESAIAQFRSLRSEHNMATMFAAQEAEWYDAKFAPTELERGFILEKRAFATWKRRGSGRRVARKRRDKFYPVFKGVTGNKNWWTRGEAYTRRWNRNMPPDFRRRRLIPKPGHKWYRAPGTTAPLGVAAPTPEVVAPPVDFLSLLTQDISRSR